MTHNQLEAAFSRHPFYLSEEGRGPFEPPYPKYIDRSAVTLNDELVKLMMIDRWYVIKNIVWPMNLVTAPIGQMNLMIDRITSLICNEGL